jgi:Zn-dependent protease
VRQSVPLGRIAGITIGLHWSVPVILLLLAQVLAMAVLPATVPGHPGPAYWLAAAGFGGLFLLTVLVQELAQALTARRYGLRVNAITLWMFGGVSDRRDDPPHPRAALRIALAGPAAGLVAAAGCGGAAALAGAAGGSGLLSFGFGWVAAAGLLMAVFNLLPGAPLDGGRALAAILWWRGDDRDLARETAANAGVWTAGVLVAGSAAATIAGHSLGWLGPGLVGLVLLSSARVEVTAARLAHGCAGVRVEQVMSTPAVCGFGGQTITGFRSAVAERVPHDAYPVVDIDGRLVGLVRLDRLLSVPPAARDATRLSEVMAPLAGVSRLRPEDGLAEATADSPDPYGLAVVLREDRPCGVLSPSDVRRALLVARLGGTPGRRDHSREAR